MAAPAPSHNVELEAAKFLHKLIQDSKDEPSKLATKLYVVSVVKSQYLLYVSLLWLFLVTSNFCMLYQILQHMKSSGKEHSMPYQVISRYIGWNYFGLFCSTFGNYCRLLLSSKVNFDLEERRILLAIYLSSEMKIRVCLLFWH